MCFYINFQPVVNVRLLDFSTTPFVRRRLPINFLILCYFECLEFFLLISSPLVSVIILNPQSLVFDIHGQQYQLLSSVISSVI